MTVKSWLWWKWYRLTYFTIIIRVKLEQRRYWKAIEVIEKVLGPKLDPVTGEPLKHWEVQAYGLRQAIESIEEDIACLDEDY